MAVTNPIQEEWELRRIGFIHTYTVSLSELLDLQAQRKNILNELQFNLNCYHSLGH